MKQLFFSFFITLIFYSANGQIYVKPNLNANVGDTLGVPNAKLGVNSQNNTHGFSVNSNINTATFKDTTTIVGIYNQLNASTLQLPIPYNNAPSRSAYKAQLNGRRDVYNNGFFLNVDEVIGNDSVPPILETNGSAQVFNNIYNNLNGVFNSYFTLNCAEAKGFGNYFTQLTENTIRVPTNLSTNFFGFYNRILPRSNTSSFGLYNSITVEPNFTGTTYGIYTKIDGDSLNGVRYGIYSEVTPVSGTKGYAGYFKGKVQVEGVLLQTSDSRLKENVENVVDATSIIRRLTPKKYDLIAERNGSSRKKHYGLIAQELETVAPDLVSDVLSPNGTRVETITNEVEDVDYVPDNTGKLQKQTKKRLVTTQQNIPLAPTSVKAVNYIELISLLIQTVKEQQALIEDLRRDVEILKRR
jgi:hypothetical protein